MDSSDLIEPLSPMIILQSCIAIIIILMCINYGMESYINWLHLLVMDQLLNYLCFYKGLYNFHAKDKGPLPVCPLFKSSTVTKQSKKECKHGIEILY